MPISRNNARRRKEAGYSLLMVVFLVATMLILAATAVPNVLVQGRREREEEMIWRGEQYKRAIGMYFSKFGRYPTKIDDLTKQTNGVRFLRQAYTDPMNKEDGSWRFIYVGANGQLIGSLRQPSLLQSALSTLALPGAGAQPGSATGTQPASPLQGPTRDSLSVPRARVASRQTGGLGAQSLGVPTSATPGQRHRWKHHWRWKQGEGIFAARLPRRRYVRAVGIHLESSANCNSRTASACEPECACRVTAYSATRPGNAAAGG